MEVARPFRSFRAATCATRAMVELARLAGSADYLLADLPPDETSADEPPGAPPYLIVLDGSVDRPCVIVLDGAGEPEKVPPGQLG